MVNYSMDILPDRIREKIQIDPMTGCWVWIAALDRNGYGRVRWGNGAKFSHRVVFELLTDIPVQGLELDHLCRKVACCNPDHLEAVSHGENVKRGVAGIALKRKYSQHLWCPKGHPLFGPNLYAATTKRGYVNKMCRECRARNSRERKERKRTASASQLF